MKKIAIVNQRYGKEVNGGSEVYAMQIAKHLTKDFEVDVVTTTALDYNTWENYYPPGIEKDGEINVLRFPVEKKRNRLLQGAMRRIFGSATWLSGLLGKVWIKAQGPYSPKAIDYLEKNERDYQAIIFVTYLYYITTIGLPKVACKAILVPTAHDEPPIYYNIYKNVFYNAKCILYLTEEEKIFTESRFKLDNTPSDVVGTGIDIPYFNFTDKERDRITSFGKYIIYVGRVDYAKGCDSLIEMFVQYKKKNNDNLNLVLVGNISMEIPDREDIIALGFVSEDEKYAVMSSAKLLVLPSQYESLSLSVLESMALEVPVLVNGKSEVLQSHCKKSRAGLYYNDENDFYVNLDTMLHDTLVYEELKRNTKLYIETNYNWENTISKYKKAINQI